MSLNFIQDIFISYAREDKDKVQLIYEKIREFGLKVFWDNNLEGGREFGEALAESLENSQHFLLYCSKDSAKKSWVQKETNLFLSQCHLKEDKRRMFILLDDSPTEVEIPFLLKTIQVSKTTDEVIQQIVKDKFNNFESDYNGLKTEGDLRISNMEKQLEQMKGKLVESQRYYRHNRFWKLISKNRDIHIFTCARDTHHDPKSLRGHGGRTNIDKWDYRAVLDITHFFALNYPTTKITIEDPISKLSNEEIKQPGRLVQRYNYMTRMLADKDCIIIASPDVNDFAEVVLAEIHHISPYTVSRNEKKKGFVIIKQKPSFSSFYWEKQKDENEGIAQILDKIEYHNHTPATEESRVGKMHGILIVANNPFCNAEERRKIIILSGFSGVATDAIAKIITDKNCIDEFYRLDEAYTDIERNVEILIGVNYVLEDSFLERDTRKIENYKTDITFEKLVEI